MVYISRKSKVGGGTQVSRWDGVYLYRVKVER